MNGRSAAIVGAGVAGLGAAIALERRGISTRVYEQAPEPRTDGGALILWTNATQALGELGLREAAVDLGTVVDGVDFRSWSGRLLWRLPVAALAERFGSPSIYLRRSDLLDVLLSALPADRLQCGAPIRGFQETDAGVHPLPVGGPVTAPDADLLVGADGLHSAIRAQLLGERSPRSAHHVGWVGFSETDAAQWSEPPGGSTILLGNGLRCCTGTLKHRPGEPESRRTVYWYATEKVSRSLDPTERIDAARLAELFDGCGLDVSGLIERTREPIPFWISDRWPSRRWGRGRATLVGDAAHPSTPDLGQGACQAIEDAVVLAKTLASETEIEPGLRRYERSRYSRTALVTALSHTTAIQSMISLPGASLIRDLAMPGLLPPISLSQFNVLLGHRV